MESAKSYTYRKNYRHHTFGDLTDYRAALQEKIYTYKNVCICVCIHTSEGRVQWGWSQALFSSDQWQKQLAKAETEEIPSGHLETLFHCQGDWTQVAQTGRAVCILENTQKSSGHGPRERAIGGCLSKMTSIGHSQLQSLYGSVTRHKIP